MSIVQLVFLLLAVLMVIGTLFPGWNFSAGPVLAPNRLIALVIGLIVLFILYLIVLAMFGAGPVAHAEPAALGGGLMLGVLDTATLPPKDPTAPKPVWQSKTFWLGIVLTLVGLSTYFTDPLHTPTLTVASISEAVGGVLAIVLRVWFTAAPIDGTPLAAKAEVAKQDIAIHAALSGPAPVMVPTQPTLDDLPGLVALLKQRRASDDALLAQLAGIAQPSNTTYVVPPGATPAPTTTG